MNELYTNSLNEIVVNNTEEAIIHVGSNGKFQKIAFVLLTICYTCTGAFITNSFVFLEKDPKFYCFKSDEWIECNRKEACSKNVPYKIEYLDIVNYSWTNDFRMECKENYLIGLFATMFFLGSMISSIFASSMSDYIGRSVMIKFSMILRSVVILIPIIFPNQYIVIVILFLIGLLNSLHSSIPYILISEYLSKNEKDKYQTYMFMFESFSGILATVFFFFCQNWWIFFIINFIYGLTFIVFQYKLLESPRFLVTQKRFSEARDVLKEIAKTNGKEEMIIKFTIENKEENDDDKYEVNSKNTVSTALLFKSKKLRIYIIVLPFIWFSTAFAFFAINFEVKYFKNEIFVSNLIIFSSEAISYFVSNKKMEILGKKNSMIVSFLISATSYFLFIFVNKENAVVIFILIFLSKYGASALLNISSIYTNEVFPTDVRGRAIGICSFFGKFGGIIAPMIVETSEYTLIISGIICIFSCIILIPLENTFSSSHLVDRIEDLEEKLNNEL